MDDNRSRVVNFLVSSGAQLGRFRFFLSTQQVSMVQPIRALDSQTLPSLPTSLQ